jgi:nifR3 family TIM-barrel protein
MRKSAEIATSASPDLIDINYGCPVKQVACKGAGAALLQDIPKMVKMTETVVNATHLPVTVKTRLGWDDNTKNIQEVAERLQDIGIKALTIHGRTRVQMYKGDADWTLIGKIKENSRINIPIFGNGDIDSPEKALEYKNRYGVDGIMIGRASIGYPWFFNEVKHFLKTGAHLPGPNIQERVEVCKQHLEFSLRWKGPTLGLIEMRRHYTNYFKHMPDFKPFRMKLVTSDSSDEVLTTLEEIKHQFELVEA